MIIELNFESEVPIYIQIRNQIVKGIASGQIALGYSLPTVRQLANEAGINPMTVNKAYGLLKQQGFIVVDRRHGAKVNAQMPNRKTLSPEMEGELALFLCEAKLVGLSEAAIIDIVKDLYRKLI